MKCPESDVLQTYMDDELELGIRKDIETHLAECDKCKILLKNLNENEVFVAARLSSYKQHFEDCSIPSSILPKAMNYKFNMSKKGVFKNMLKYRKIVAAACAVLLITTLITVEPVRAAISSALSIFRVENVKGITLTIEDIREIQNNLSKGEGEISLDKMGSIKIQGGKSKTASQEDVKNLPDLEAVFPTSLSGIEPVINVVEPAAIDFTLDVKNANQIMKSYGATKFLPENIDGKTFRIDISSQVTMKYDIDGKRIVILQTKSPNITVPEGVNVDEVYNALVEMPILPQNLQSQLKSIKDWKNTLYIPVAESEMTGVDINGVKGYLTRDFGDTEEAHESVVIWYNKGVIYAVSGRVDDDEILKIARSMR